MWCGQLSGVRGTTVGGLSVASPRAPCSACPGMGDPHFRLRRTDVVYLVLAVGGVRVEPGLWEAQMRGRLIVSGACQDEHVLAAARPRHSGLFVTSPWRDTTVLSGQPHLGIPRRYSSPTPGSRHPHPTTTQQTMPLPHALPQHGDHLQTHLDTLPRAGGHQDRSTAAQHGGQQQRHFPTRADRRARTDTPRQQSTERRGRHRLAGSASVQAGGKTRGLFRHSGG